MGKSLIHHNNKTSSPPPPYRRHLATHCSLYYKYLINNRVWVNAWWLSAVSTLSVYLLSSRYMRPGGGGGLISYPKYTVYLKQHQYTYTHNLIDRIIVVCVVIIMFSNCVVVVCNDDYVFGDTPLKAAPEMCVCCIWWLMGAHGGVSIAPPPAARCRHGDRDTVVGDHSVTAVTPSPGGGNDDDEIRLTSLRATIGQNY